LKKVHPHSTIWFGYYWLWHWFIWPALEYNGWLGTPFVVVGFAIINMLVGIVLFRYVLIPISYWNNIYDAKKFPIISSKTYDSSGAKYNITRILANFDIDMDSYKQLQQTLS